MWFFVIFAVLAGMLFWPLQLVAAYDSKGGRVYIRYGLLVLTLYPSNNKQDGTSNKPPEAANPDNPNKTQKSPLEGWIDYLHILRMSFEPICELRRYLRVDRLKLKVILAKEDPFDLSVLYGRTWAVVSDLQMRLNRLFRIKKQSVDLLCDFTGNRTVVQAYTRISITTIRLLILLFRYGFGIINEYAAIKNRRKGGITNEQKTS